MHYPAKGVKSGTNWNVLFEMKQQLLTGLCNFCRYFLLEITFFGECIECVGRCLLWFTGVEGIFFFSAF
jgi:hypothetical protein